MLCYSASKSQLININKQPSGWESYTYCILTSIAATGMSKNRHKMTWNQKNVTVKSRIPSYPDGFWMIMDLFCCIWTRICGNPGFWQEWENNPNSHTSMCAANNMSMFICRWPCTSSFIQGFGRTRMGWSEVSHPVIDSSHLSIQHIRR